MADNEYDIAVVGMSCRFPGANTIEQFWQNLANGVESITRFSDEEILRSGVPAEYLEDPHYVKAAPVIDSPELFDASFFGFAPMEAKMMDPQHRILLELAYEALEDAGCDPERYGGRFGVFSGSALNTYFMNEAVSDRFAVEYIPTLIGNDKDFISTRVSYKLNLKGPSLNIQTACSTALVAVHLACQSLLSGESDAALAGAISVRVPHQAGYLYDGGGIVSPDGRVRAFDAGANGTVFGSGGGVVLLKRHSDALAEGDTIHAVVKGSAVNNDGSEKAGYTAPSVNSQADAVVEALANAGIDAQEISYIETHGSGTPVGDPIEVKALTTAFRTFTEKKGFCAIGSVKTNIGHLDAAAGMASLIKTVLALKHRKIPASLHYENPNPEIDFPSSPFYVNTRHIAWSANGPRRAGVLATGMGGTNAFLVVEQAPSAEVTDSADAANLLVLSAKTETALDAATQRLGEYLKQDDSANLADVAFTLQVGRKAYRHRRFLVCADKADAIGIIGQENSKKMITTEMMERAERPVVFMLPGIGDHYVGMASDLYQHFEVFRNEFDRCAGILKDHIDVDIHEILYPMDGGWKKKSEASGIDLKKMLARQSDDPVDPSTQRLNRTIYAHPAQFTIEYALAQLWMHLGVKPDAIVGHSMGEYAAACLAGVMSLEDALRLVSIRARLANELPQGAMLAVMLTEDQLLPLLKKDLSIALINGPNLCVVAGPVSDVTEFENVLKDQKAIYRSVQNAHAFHSKMMDSIVDAFEAEVRQVRLREAGIPFISNVTGNWISPREATDPAYWSKHANHTARFSEALGNMWRYKDAAIIEVGPGRTLGMLAMQHPARQHAGNPITCSSLRDHYDNQNDVTYLLKSIGSMWAAGLDMEWEKLDQRKRKRRISLPTYPFERQKYWIENTIAPREKIDESGHIKKNPKVSEWFYVPSWKRMPAVQENTDVLIKRIGKGKSWLVFKDDLGLGDVLIHLLEAAGQKVVTIVPAREYREIDSKTFALNTSDPGSYVSMVRALQSRNMLPDNVLHAWNVTAADGEGFEGDFFGEVQEFGFYSLIFLAKAFAKNKIDHDMNLLVLSNHIQDVQSRDLLHPEKSTILGPCMVISQEYPNIRTKCVDLDTDAPIETHAVNAGRIIAEMFDEDADLFVAHRSGQRWIQTYEKVRLNEEAVARSVFRTKGVYLITGGLGVVGYEIAKYLAKTYKAKLVVTGRTILPDRKKWNERIENDSENSVIRKKIQNVLALEKSGAEVLYFDAGAADIDRMREVASESDKRLGAINGVIHAAGIVDAAGYGEIKDINIGNSHLHFDAKAKGVIALDGVFKDKEPDFCLLFSSLTSILGGIGQVAYSSANIFMDAFARLKSRATRFPWISVNWDVWRLQNETGFGAASGKTLEQLGKTSDEGMAAMEMALAIKDASQLAVSTGDLRARINQWIRLESLRDMMNKKDVHAFSSTSARPNLDTAYDAPRDDTEKVIAHIWQEVLGIKNIGLNDHFSDLGGHSLLAIKIVAGLRKAFHVDLPVRALFDKPTVSKLSEDIKERILSEIENMSDDEAERLISNSPQ